MERDGLLTVQGDRHLELSVKGRRMATRVMRKHRLAERLLVDVIGLDWELAHVEACRWEHVISEDVERRLVDILDHPTISPYGNPIPGLDELGELGSAEEFLEGVVSLASIAASLRGGDEAKVMVRRISEPLQTTPEVMEVLRRAKALPGKVVTVATSPRGALISGVDAAGPATPPTAADDGTAQRAGTAEVSTDDATHIFVKRI
jgi:DtxR family Mn-dependent transcriptional regulator